MVRDWRKILFGLAIGALFLALAFRRVDLTVLVRELAGFNPWWLPLFVVCHLTSLVLRSWRWQGIVGPVRPVGLGVLFPITVRGFLISNLVPMKAGDLYRFYALSRQTGLEKATAVGTLVVERLADLIGLVLLSVALALMLDLPPAIHRALVWLGVAAGVVVVLWWSVRRLPALADRFNRMKRYLATWVEHSPVGRVMVNLRQGFAVMKDRRQWVAILARTALIFLTVALGILAILRGFGLVVISPLASLALLVFIFWTSVLPQAPAGLGTFEYATILALQLFGVGRETALASALVLHAGVIVNLLVISGITFLLQGSSRRATVPVAVDPAVEVEGPQL
ncbi:MAG: lysylphosphatidylglycerol synthase transmembrane domain-containing protein [bacterium]|nr:lysylphosphatidylglycerol synthase transmembrane domain-containing protein [bacterium]